MIAEDEFHDFLYDLKNLCDKYEVYIRCNTDENISVSYNKSGGDFWIYWIDNDLENS